MSDDKIAEIRARHELVGSSGSVIHPTGFSWTIPGWVAHNDRAWLLAEVERHRAEIERLRAEIERLRAALGGICIDGPDADGLVWVTIKHPAIAVQIHVMVGNVNRMVSQAFMEFEEMRRNALEGKP